jgi:thiol-disulfide isomerase/thioredoxin
MFPMQRAAVLFLAPALALSLAHHACAQDSAQSSADAPVAATAVSSPDEAYKADPKFQKAWSEGLQYARRSDQQVFAVDAFRKANKIAGGKCVECLQRMLHMQLAGSMYGDAVPVAVQLEALATTPRDKAYAEEAQGVALFMGAGDKPRPAKLEEADAALKASIGNNPHNRNAWYTDGQVLAYLHKDDEAKAAFQHFVDLAPTSDRHVVRAEHFIDNPDLARQKMAPPFTVVTEAGREFTLDDMGGKVVLIDFWATWCGPCNEELPNVKKIAKDFANEPFELISVSWDNDDGKWRDFINKNEMTWNQYRDASHKLSTAFGINEIPHYFTIDSDGVLRAEIMGSGNDVEGKLKKLVAKARAAQAAAAPKPGQ